MRINRLTLIAIFLATILTGCSDYQKEQPSNKDIVGRWNVVEITSIVEKWLNNNGIESLPSDTWIEFHEDGSFAAHDLPIMLLETEGHEIKCTLFTGKGHWHIQDNSVMKNMLQWKVQLEIDLPNQSWYLACHKDSQGLYLVDGMDWETSTGVTLKKI